MITKTLIEQMRQEVRADIKELLSAGLLNIKEQFIPCGVHYPLITNYPLINENELLKTYSNPQDSLFVVYVHIPFCIKYCAFCHYPVKLGELPEEKEYYLNMLEKEMDIYMKRLNLKKIFTRSILVGGGTPTYLTPDQLKRFLSSFISRLDLSQCTQFSYDVDPCTLLGDSGEQRMKIMRSYGVDRLTIGIQSLDDKILKKMNRPHNSQEAVESIDKAKSHGFKINIEFIYGYPEQSIESWIDTMGRAVKLGVEEIQLYHLKIVPYGDHNAYLTKQFIEHPELFPKGEDTLVMKKLAILILSRNNYKENLTRVFSRKADDFSHYADDQCCKLYDQIGFGLTAFSSLRDRFGLNTQDFKEYYSLIEKGSLPINRGIIRDKDDQLRWAFMLPLKNRKVYKRYYHKMTGESPNDIFYKKIKKLKEFGLLHDDDKAIELTKRGRFFSDEVCYQFFHPKHMVFSESEFHRGRLSPFLDTELQINPT
jgi:oxygen-independent coproporphyrinogen III oxidase